MQSSWSAKSVAMPSFANRMNKQNIWSAEALGIQYNVTVSAKTILNSTFGISRNNILKH